MPLRSKGAAAAEKSQAESGRKFGKHDYAKFEEKVPVVLRFLTDYEDWPSGLVHQSIPTKPAPEGQKNWPAFMSALCTQDADNFQDPDTKAWDEGYGPGTCWIHEHMKGKKDQWGKDQTKTSVRCWAVAVVQEETGSPGNWTARDKLKEGKPHLVIVNQGFYGFFSTLHGLAQANGTIRDRCIVVTKKPKDGGSFAEYSIVPRDKDTERQPGSEAFQAWEAAAEDQKLTLEKLQAIVYNQSTKDYYDRFFDPTVETKASGDEEEDAAAGTGAPAAELEDGALKEMEGRVLGRLAGANAADVSS